MLIGVVKLIGVVWNVQAGSRAVLLRLAALFSSKKLALGGRRNGSGSRGSGDCGCAAGFGADFGEEGFEFALFQLGGEFGGARF